MKLINILPKNSVCCSSKLVKTCIE